VRVSRTAQAETDAFEIALTISEDSLDAALRFLDNLEATVRQLERSRSPAPALRWSAFPTCAASQYRSFPNTCCSTSWTKTQ
jgi:hypothetical protein